MPILYNVIAQLQKAHYTGRVNFQLEETAEIHEAHYNGENFFILESLLCHLTTWKLALSSQPPILLPHQLLHTLQHPSLPALLITINSYNILEFCTALQKHYRYVGSHLIGWPATRENYWSPCFVECLSNHWVTCIHCFWVSIATIKLQVVHSPSCKCL